MNGRPSPVRAYDASHPYAGRMPEIYGYSVDSSYINWPVRWTATFSRKRSGGADGKGGSAPRKLWHTSPGSPG